MMKVDGTSLMKDQGGDSMLERWQMFKVDWSDREERRYSQWATEMQDEKPEW